MAHCHGKLNLPLACICISILILIQFKIASCANEGNATTSVGITKSLPTLMKNKTPNKKHKLFDGSLEGIDLTIIPGWRDEDDFDNWVPPREIQRDFPTYIAGFDNSSRPIWVMELGRYNFGKYVYAGKAKRELFHKYFRYLAYIGLKSHSLRSTVEQPVLKHVKIYDYEGFKPSFLTDLNVYNFMKKFAASYVPYYVKYVSRIVHINVNSVAEIWVNVHGKIRGHFNQYRRGNQEFYGTNKYEWGPKLALTFPVNQLPEWYGGSKDFKPIYVMG